MPHGQEIYIFFYKFGLEGFIGIFICSILIGIVVYKTFLIVYAKENKIENYQDFLNTIFKFPKTNKKYLNISFISNKIITIFLLITFYIMVSGFGTYFEQQFKLNKIIVSILFVFLCYIVLKKNISGVTKVNSIVVPALIVIITIISTINLKNIDFKIINTKFSNLINQNNNNLKWLLNAVLYCSYNMILIIPLLVTLKKYIKSKKHITIISVFTSIIVFCLAGGIFLWLASISANYENIQMPAVFVIDKLYPNFRTIYGIAILFSIFSTAIAVGISFIQNIEIKNDNVLKIMCITAIFISQIPFSKLIKLLFPLFGYIGLLQIIFIRINKKASSN